MNSTVNRSSTLKSRYRLCLVPYLPLHGDLVLTRASIPQCPFLLFKALSSHTHLYLHSLPTLSFLSLSALSHFIHQFPQSRVGEYLPLIFSSGVIYGLGIHFEEEPNILSVSLQLVNPDWFSSKSHLCFYFKGLNICDIQCWATFLIIVSENYRTWKKSRHS